MGITLGKFKQMYVMINQIKEAKKVNSIPNLKMQKMIPLIPKLENACKFEEEYFEAMRSLIKDEKLKLKLKLIKDKDSLLNLDQYEYEHLLSVIGIMIHTEYIKK